MQKKFNILTLVASVSLFIGGCSANPGAVSISEEDAPAHYLGAVCQTNLYRQVFAGTIPENFDVTQTKDLEFLQLLLPGYQAALKKAVAALDPSKFSWPNEANVEVANVYAMLDADLTVVKSISAESSIEDIGNAFGHAYDEITANVSDPNVVFDAGKNARKKLGISADTEASCDTYATPLAVDGYSIPGTTGILETATRVGELGNPVTLNWGGKEAVSLTVDANVTKKKCDSYGFDKIKKGQKRVALHINSSATEILARSEVGTITSEFKFLDGEGYEVTGELDYSCDNASSWFDLSPGTKFNRTLYFDFPANTAMPLFLDLNLDDYSATPSWHLKFKLLESF